MNNQQRAENAIKWIETLLKTRMKQGRGKLGDSVNGYCCLGVACKTLGMRHEPEDEFLNITQADALGLRNYEGEPKQCLGEENIIPLPELNDDKWWTFNTIGKHLIEWSEEYFDPGVAKLIKKHFQES